MFNFKSTLLQLTFIFLFAFVGMSNLSAQKVMDKMVDQACKQIEAMDDDLSAKEIEKELEQVMINVVMTNFSEISDEYGIDLDDGEEAFVKLGEELGMRLAQDCDGFLVIAMKMGAADLDEEETTMVEVATVSGKFVGMEGDEFVYIKIQEGNGRTKKLFWGEPFDGDIHLMNPKKLKGKKIEVSYIEKEVYNAKVKDYTTIREITALSVK